MNTVFCTRVLPILCRVDGICLVSERADKNVRITEWCVVRILKPAGMNQLVGRLSLVLWDPLLRAAFLFRYARPRLEGSWEGESTLVRLCHHGWGSAAAWSLLRCRQKL